MDMQLSENFFELLQTWYITIEEVKRIKEQPDLNDEFYALIQKVRTNLTVTEEDLYRFEDITKRYWKRNIMEECQQIKDKIEKRKTKGQPFSDVLKALGKVKRKSEMDLDVGDFSKVFQELMDIWDEVEERISIERHFSRQFWKGLIIGALITLIVSIGVSYHFCR